MIRANELKCDVVEMMACVYGCQCGGGQPKIPPAKKADYLKRTEELDKLDVNSEFRVASENVDVIGWIDSHLNAHEQHELLHTSYQARYPQA